MARADPQTTSDDERPAAIASGPITLDCGCDPTAPSLHIGKQVQILTRRRFQFGRDGDAMRAQWEVWQCAEEEFLNAEGTSQASDFVVVGMAPVPDAW